jgi:glutathione peroxidase-family protein
MSKGPRPKVWPKSTDPAAEATNKKQGLTRSAHGISWNGQKYIILEKNGAYVEAFHRPTQSGFEARRLR